jgi:hypothetical protein
MFAGFGPCQLQRVHETALGDFNRRSLTGVEAREWSNNLALWIREQRRTGHRFTVDAGLPEPREHCQP